MTALMEMKARSGSSNKSNLELLSLTAMAMRQQEDVHEETPSSAASTAEGIRSEGTAKKIDGGKPRKTPPPTEVGYSIEGYEDDDDISPIPSSSPTQVFLRQSLSDKSALQVKTQSSFPSGSVISLPSLGSFTSNPSSPQLSGSYPSTLSLGGSNAGHGSVSLLAPRSDSEQSQVVMNSINHSHSVPNLSLASVGSCCGCSSSSAALVAMDNSRGGPSSSFTSFTPIMNSISQSHSVPNLLGASVGSCCCSLAMEKLLTENQRLRQELEASKSEAIECRERAFQLEKSVNELKQLPTGKISQIPVE